MCPVVGFCMATLRPPGVYRTFEPDAGVGCPTVARAAAAAGTLTTSDRKHQPASNKHGHHVKHAKRRAWGRHGAEHHLRRCQSQDHVKNTVAIGKALGTPVSTPGGGCCVISDDTMPSAAIAVGVAVGVAVGAAPPPTGGGAWIAGSVPPIGCRTPCDSAAPATIEPAIPINAGCVLVVVAAADTADCAAAPVAYGSAMPAPVA